MKNFKINFEDAEGNTIYTIVSSFIDESYAIKYAITKLANTSDDCVSFEIYDEQYNKY